MKNRTLCLWMAGTMLLSLMVGCSEGNSSSKPAESSPAPAVESQQPQREGETLIHLSDEEILVDGQAAGTEASAAVYLSKDIIYYEDKEVYESGYPYGEGTAEERHSAEEAAAHTVVNIGAAGTYRLSGSLSLGQIRVDLGEEAFEDESAVVTLILDGVDINCDVAPAILFLSVYECDNQWSTETAQSQVDTSAAGANIILADGSENNIEGSYVARIYKDKEGEKKLWKQDGALYSYMSMNVDGEAEGSGVLNLNAENEGLDTEMHLTLNGGRINIFSGNDGINTNEDGVSVTTINGGEVHIVAGLGVEGDGIDSNGWLVINGGTVISSANPAADAGLDSDMGSFINGGTVVALGSTMDWAESESAQVAMNLQFAEYKDSTDAIVICHAEGDTVFSYDPSEDAVLGGYQRQYMGAIVSCPAFAQGDSYQVYVGDVMQSYTGTDVMMGPGGFGGGMGGGRPGGMWGGERPEGEMPPEMPEGMGEGQQPPEMPEGGMEPPEGWEPGNGEIPERPEGWDPENGEMPQMPGGEAQQGGRENANTLFYMQDMVNFFSGLADAE